jgi:DNA gyrase subunit B/topoisomerase-4 subunit B
LSNYTAKDITVLEGLEPVRKRPGMYIGGVGSAGLHHLVWEILDNSVDEAMNGHASNIAVTLHADGSSITIGDDGRGIPVDKHPKTKKSALEVIFTVLHAGGKFEQGNYKTAGGLHGVGASVVNALSTVLRAGVKRDGALWELEFKRGVPQGSIRKVGPARGTGTTVFFHPDSIVLIEQAGIRVQNQYKQEYLGNLLTADIIYGVKLMRTVGVKAVISPA